MNNQKSVNSLIQGYSFKEVIIWRDHRLIIWWGVHFNASVWVTKSFPRFWQSNPGVALAYQSHLNMVPCPRIEPRTPGMTSRHSTPQLQSMDKSSVWKLNWCPVSLNLHPQESHNFDMSVLDLSGTGPLMSQFLVSVISSKSQVT